MNIKRQFIIFIVVFLMCIMIAGGTCAWFISSSDISIEEPKMGTVKVDVIENGLNDIKVKNYGTSQIYIRARLIPQWSDQNLSISNVEIKLANDWIERDGYYYYKDPIKENEITASIIEDIIYGELTSEYEGETLTVKVDAEGVQSRHEAWKELWTTNGLP